jgi:hypothetical protein
MTVEYRGVIQPLPSLREPEQREIIAKFEPTEVYCLGRESTHDDILRQQRQGRVVVTPWAACLARQKGNKDSRIANLLEFKDDLHSRGGYILEAKTGLQSNKAADWRAMREKAAQMLGRIAQGAQSAENARKGRHGFDFEDADIQHMLRVMDSRAYGNDRSRRNAIRKLGIEPVPKRTWLLTKLKLIARERGL